MTLSSLIERIHYKLIKIAGYPEDRLKPNILLCGGKIARDKMLVKMLLANANVSILRDISQLETTVRKHHIVLIVVELSRSWKKDLAAVHSLKANLPHILIVIVNGGGSQEIVIQSFRSGAIDFFKKPYTKELLAERVNALSKINKVQNNE